MLKSSISGFFTAVILAITFISPASAFSISQTLQQNAISVFNQDGYSAQQLFGLLSAGATLNGKLIMPLAGSVPITGPLMKVGGKLLAVPGKTTFNTDDAGVSIVYGPNSSSIFRQCCGALPQFDAFRAMVTNGPGINQVGQVTGVAGYVRGLVPNAGEANNNGFSVGLYGAATCEVNLCNSWAANTVVSDAAPTAADQVRGTGVGRTIQGFENDLNIFKDGTVGIGMNIVGNFFTPAASTFGVNLTLNTASPPWSQGFTTSDGSTSKAFVAGPNARSGKSVPSALSMWTYFDRTGSRGDVSLNAVPNTAGGADLRLVGGYFSSLGYHLDSGGVLTISNATAGGADLLAIYSDSSNALHVGGATNGIALESNATPASPQISLGTAAKPFGNIVGVTFMEKLSTPSSSTAPCIAGQFTDDVSYHYICTATNHWRRSAYSDF